MATKIDVPGTISSIYLKMAKVQMSMKTFSKTADNPFFNSKYVPLEAIQKELVPICLENHLLIFHTGTETESGRFVITTIVRDLDSGEELPSDFPLPTGGGDKEATSQQIGAGESYGMRYNLKKLFNIIIEGEDDDGNEASKAGIPKGNPKPKQEPGADMAEYPDSEITHTPKCSVCGTPTVLKNWKDKAGKPYSRYKCPNTDKHKDKKDDGGMWPSAWEKLKNDVPFE